MHERQRRVDRDLAGRRRVRDGDARHRPVRRDVHVNLRSALRRREAAHRARRHAASDAKGGRGQGRVHDRGQAPRVPADRRQLR